MQQSAWLFVAVYILILKDWQDITARKGAYKYTRILLATISLYIFL